MHLSLSLSLSLSRYDKKKTQNQSPRSFDPPGAGDGSTSHRGFYGENAIDQ